MHVNTDSRAGASHQASRHTMLVRSIISNKICFNTGKSTALSSGILVVY